MASLALLVQLHDLLDEHLVDLEQRVDALLLTRLCDGRDGRLGERLDGRVGSHGLGGCGLGGGRIHGLGGGQAWRLGLLGRRIRRRGAVVLAGSGRRGLAVLDKLLVGRGGEGLGEGCVRVRARLALVLLVLLVLLLLLLVLLLLLLLLVLLVLLLLLLLLLVLQRGGFMAVSGRRGSVTAWGTA